MTEFKGTKGKWEVTTSGEYSGEYYLTADKFAPTFGEDIANAQLISKAPELLDTVNELLELLSFHGYNNSTEIYKAKELIKEATEI